MDVNVLAAYEARVIRNDGAACWGWRGCIEKSGYATFTLADLQPRRAHRVAYEAFVADRFAGVTLQTIGDRYGCTKQAVRHMLAVYAAGASSWAN